MKKAGGIALITLGTPIAAALVALLAVNLYIQSDKTQAKIERKLNETLRMPLRIGRTSFTPWGGLNVTGVTVPQTDPQSRGNFFKAQECRIHLQFGPLFRRKLVIDQVMIEGPKVVWNQNAGGRWEFPSSTPPIAAEPSAPSVPSIEPVSAPEPVAPPPAGEQPAPIQPFEVIIARLKIQHGLFDFCDAAHRPVALFSGVNVDIPSAKPDLFEGESTCDKITLRDLFHFESFKTRFSYSKEQLVLSDLNAALAGGRMEGGFALKPREEKSPFRTDIRFEKIDLNRLITEAGGPPDQAGGNFAGSLNLAGNAGNPGSISGAGRIDLFNGEIAQYQLLQELGKLLRIEELTRPRLDQAFAAFHVHEGQVLIDQLLLQSTNLRITAHGSIGFDGRIDLDAHLLINAKISAQLPDFIRDSFSPDATPGARFLDFKVGGKIDKPTTSLSDFLGNVGKQLEKKVGKWGVDLLRNILGSKKLNGDDSPATQAPAPPNPPNPK